MGKAPISSIAGIVQCSPGDRVRDFFFFADDRLDSFELELDG
jgi:hypothetical protein